MAVEITEKEKILLGKFLDEAADTLSNRVCNDVDPDWYEDWTEEEKKYFNLKINKWNGIEDENDEDYCDHFYTGYDWMILKYFSELFLEVD